VGTVDSFQGQERDICRINVGMTRARRKLLLVGDSSTLCSHPFFVELLTYVKGVWGYRTAYESLS
jgi:ATP-dependent RNA/DNA helicase IGHMBP2